MGIKVAQRGTAAWSRVILSSVAIAACVMGSGAANAVFGTSAASECNPLAIDTCGLPFPSDLFRNLGGTYNYDNVIMDKKVTTPRRSRLLATTKVLPESFRPWPIFKDSRGFSALGPVLFELKKWPFTEIPKDGEGYLHVYKMSTGERVPMVVSLSEAAKAEGSVRAGRPVIVGWPELRFDYGERYIAILLKDGFNSSLTGGQEVFTPNEGVQNALSEQAGDILNYVYKRPLSSIASLGIAHEDILSFTWFTVRPQDEVTQPMFTMVEKALNTSNYIYGLEVAESAVGDAEYGLVTLNGKVSTVNFRAEDGGVFPPYDIVEDVERSDVEFNLTLPKVEGSLPIPISLWGHGLGGSKDFKITNGNFELGDRLGMATIGIDHPNHGTRVNPVTDYSSGITDVEELKRIFGKEPYIGNAITSPFNMMQLLGMFVQDVIDQNVLIHSAKYRLPSVLADWEHPDYPDVPLLDGSRVIYDSLSLGAMVGTTVGATAPELTGAYLVNGSGSLMQILTESTFWPLTNNVIPQTLNGAQMMFVVAMMQHYLDIADGNNFAQFYRELPNGYGPRKVVMHYSLGDGSVPNPTSLAFARLADLPLVQEIVEPELSLRFGDTGLEGFEDGYGMLQSGYGLELAEQSLGSFGELDLEDELGIPGVGSFDDFISDLDLSQYGLDSTLEQAFGLDNANSLDEYVQLIYSGETSDFLTHFNRGNENARHRQIEWRCNLLDLAPERCLNAKDIATEEIERIENGEYFGSDRNQGGIVDDFNKSLDNIKVTEGSGGSLGWISLLLLVLLGWHNRRRQLRPIPVSII